MHRDKAALALANRILYSKGVVDAFGHVSVRAAQDATRFYLSRNMAPALVTEQDIVEFDLDGRIIDGSTSKVYLERFIHGSIYRARPDVMSIVHSHSKALIPFGVTKMRLRPIWHMSGFLAEEVPRFEIRSCAGEESNMLITSAALGDALARSLDKNAVVLMRGHGATIVGPSLQAAVFRAVYAQANAEIQAAASALGDVVFLNPAEARNSDAANSGQVDRAWDLWSSEAD
ncbi:MULTISPECIES: class II aldolase/adducin family protein [Neorhizobium]|uniref:class II aldolase/adducin family protein n=1 Tax=Neorhizobium TaxID=1525371 RepID=UPI000CFA68EC|nr:MULTISPECIES: class II aldolase/adducin family protein [Neorhizobium]